MKVKMMIKTPPKEVEIEVSLPAFRKYKSGSIIKIMVTENKLISIVDSSFPEIYTCIAKTNISDAFGDDFVDCTQEEAITLFNKTKAKIEQQLKSAQEDINKLTTLTQN
jgi:antirestriction protein